MWQVVLATALTPPLSFSLIAAITLKTSLLTRTGHALSQFMQIPPLRKLTWIETRLLHQNLEPTDPNQIGADENLANENEESEPNIEKVEKLENVELSQNADKENIKIENVDNIEITNVENLSKDLTQITVVAAVEKTVQE